MDRKLTDEEIIFLSRAVLQKDIEDNKMEAECKSMLNTYLHAKAYFLKANKEVPDTLKSFLECYKKIQQKRKKDMK